MRLEKADPVRRAGAVAVFVVLLVGCLVAGMLEPRSAVQVGATPLWLANLVVVGAAGLVVAWKRPRNAIGWLLLTAVLLQVVSLASAAYAQMEYASSSPGRFALLGAWLGSWTWFPSLVLPVGVLPAIYPTGQPDSRPARVVMWSGVAGTAAMCVVLGLGPDAPGDIVPGLRMPYGDPPAWLGLTLLIPAVAALAVGVVGGLGLAVIRTLRSRGAERAQMMWLMVPAVLSVPFFFVSVPWAPPWYACIGAAVAIGVLKYRLLDIDVVVRRTLFYVPLIALVAVAVAGLSTLITRVTPAGPMPLLVAAAVVAVLVGPVSQVLRRGVDRLVLGARADPVQVVRRVVADEAALSDDPLSSLLEALTGAVGVTYAAVTDPRGGSVAEVGCRPREVVAFELHGGGEALGVLILGSPPDAAGARIAATLVPHVANVLRTQRLILELDVQRGRASAATVIERERIRSDLHDGLGPALSGISLGLQAADSAMSGEEPVARAILRRARTAADEAVGEVRRVLDALGPAALEVQHLPAAIDAAAHQLGFNGTAGPSFGCTARGSLEMPSHIEDAAYRITGEALHNVARHAHATHCQVGLVGRDGVLELDITDDGVGVVDRPASTGHTCVGIDSMRRRAHALGGTFQLSPGPTGTGTAVHVRLPLAVQA